MSSDYLLKTKNDSIKMNCDIKRISLLKLIKSDENEFFTNSSHRPLWIQNKNIDSKERSNLFLSYHGDFSDIQKLRLNLKTKSFFLNNTQWCFQMYYKQSDQIKSIFKNINLISDQSYKISTENSTGKRYSTLLLKIEVI
jgi:hypothetical protein